MQQIVGRAEGAVRLVGVAYSRIDYTGTSEAQGTCKHDIGYAVATSPSGARLAFRFTGTARTRPDGRFLAERGAWRVVKPGRGGGAYTVRLAPGGACVVLMSGSVRPGRSRPQP